MMQATVDCNKLAEISMKQIQSFKLTLTHGQVWFSANIGYNSFISFISSLLVSLNLHHCPLKAHIDGKEFETGGRRTSQQFK